MYTWTTDVREKGWNNETRDNIEECIEDAKAMYEVVSEDVIYIGKCQDVGFCGFDFRNVLMKMEQYIDEEDAVMLAGRDISSTFGNYAYRIPIYKKYNEKFLQLVEDYIKEIGETPHAYNIVDIQKIKIEQENN